MSRLKNSFIASIGLLALIGVIALLTPRTGQSQTDTVGPPKPVLVINSPSEPVPVTGTVNVGSLGAQPAIRPRRGQSRTAAVPIRQPLVLDLPSGGNSGTLLRHFLSFPPESGLVLEHASVHAVLPRVDAFAWRAVVLT